MNGGYISGSGRTHFHRAKSGVSSWARRERVAASCYSLVGSSMRHLRTSTITGLLCLTLALDASGVSRAHAAEPSRDGAGDNVKPGEKKRAPDARPSQPAARPNPPPPAARPAPPRQPVVQTPPSQQPRLPPQARTPRNDDRRGADRSDRGGDFRPGRGQDDRRGDYGRVRGGDDRRGYGSDRGRDDDRYARRRNFGLGAGVVIIGGLLGYELYRGDDRDRIFERCDRNFPDFDYDSGSFVNEDGDREICPYLVD